MNTESKKYIIVSALFCVLTLVIFLLFQFKVISNLDALLCMVYVTYFTGLALYYNAVNLRDNGKGPSSKICLAFSLILILISIAVLIYGFVTGYISLW